MTLYIPPVQQINISKLTKEFQDAGLPINSNSIGWQNDQSIFYVWSVRPTTLQLQTANNIVANHDPTSDLQEDDRINFEGTTRIIPRTAFKHTSGSSPSILASFPVPLTSDLMVIMVVMSASSTGTVKNWLVSGTIKRLNGDPVFVPSGSPGENIAGPFSDTGLTGRTFVAQVDTVNDRVDLVGTPEGNVEIDWSIFALGFMFNP